MYRGHIRWGDTELINHDRLFTYLTTGKIVPPGDFQVLDMDRWRWQFRWMGHAPYRTPRLDNAPWYSPHIPASAEFAGLHLRSYTGMDDAGFTREAQESIVDGGAHGIGRFSAKRIELKLTAYGATHAGLMHGIEWLQNVLLRPVCDDRDATVSMRYLTTVPRVAVDVDNPSTGTLTDCVDPYKRVLHDTACTVGHTVDRWWIPDVAHESGEHMAADLTVVITAADPFPYRDSLIDLSGPLSWAAAPTQTVTWKVAYFGICDDGAPPTTLVNPNAPVLAPVRRPVVASPNRICLPLYYRTVTDDITIDASTGTGDVVLTVSVQAGGSDLENIVVRFRDLTTDRVVGEIGVSYLPAGARLTVDGTTGRAVAILSDGSTRDASGVVSAGTLGPLSSVVLSCLRTYRIEAVAPDDVHAGASVSVYGTTRQVA